MKIPEIFLIEVERRAGSLAEVLEAVGRAGLLVDGLESVKRTAAHTVWELTEALGVSVSPAAWNDVLERLPELRS